MVFYMVSTWFFYTETQTRLCVMHPFASCHAFSTRTWRAWPLLLHRLTRASRPRVDTPRILPPTLYSPLVPPDCSASSAQNTNLPLPPPVRLSLSSSFAPDPLFPPDPWSVIRDP